MDVVELQRLMVRIMVEGQDTLNQAMKMVSTATEGAKKTIESMASVNNAAEKTTRALADATRELASAEKAVAEQGRLNLRIGILEAAQIKENYNLRAADARRSQTYQAERAKERLSDRVASLDAANARFNSRIADSLKRDSARKAAEAVRAAQLAIEQSKLDALFASKGGKSVSGNLTPLQAIGETVRTLSKSRSVFGSLPGVFSGIGSSLATAFPWTAKFGSQIGSLFGSASAAGKGIGMLSRSIGGMGRSLGSINSSLSGFRLGMAGLAGVGLATFANFDDGLIRVMAHMGDFQQRSRPTLEAGVLGLSGTNATSSAHLISGLDVLASRGMSAAMAVKAMGIAQQFSIAGDMEMGAATQRLTDIQWSFGMATEDAGKHLENMNQIGNLISGMAPRVGSSVDQLSAAFGNRFANSARLLNMSLEDSVALLSLYSEAGLKGVEASDRASMALTSMMLQSNKDRLAWQSFGLQMFDAEGKFIGIGEAIHKLDAALVGLSPQAKTLTLQLAGFEKRSIDGIRPLLGLSDRFKELRGSMAGMDDVMKKMALMREGSFLNQIKVLWNNIQNLAEVIGKQLAPMIVWLSKQIIGLTQWFMQLNPAFQKLIVVVGLFIAAMWAIGPIVGLIGSLTGSVLGLGFAFLTALLNPITWVVLLAGALLTLSGVAGSTFKWLWSVVSGGVGSFKDVAAAAAGFFYNFQANIGPLWIWFQTNWDKLLTDALTAGVQFAKNVGSAIWEWITWSFGYIRIQFADLMNWMGAKATEWSSNLSADITFAIANANPLRVGRDAEDKRGKSKVSAALEAQVKIANSSFEIEGVKMSIQQALKTIGMFREDNIDQIFGATGKSGGNLFHGAGFISDALPEFNLKLAEATDSFAGLLPKINTYAEKIDSLFMLDATKGGMSARGLVGVASVIGETFPFNQVGGLVKLLENTGFLRPPKTPYGGDSTEAQNIPGKSGPGFNFMQISRQRYMTGGYAAETLDYQQLVILKGMFAQGKESLNLQLRQLAATEGNSRNKDVVNQYTEDQQMEALFGE